MIFFCLRNYWFNNSEKFLCISVMYFHVYTSTKYSIAWIHIFVWKSIINYCAIDIHKSWGVGGYPIMCPGEQDTKLAQHWVDLSCLPPGDTSPAWACYPAFTLKVLKSHLERPPYWYPQSNYCRIRWTFPRRTTSNEMPAAINLIKITGASISAFRETDTRRFVSINFHSVVKRITVILIW